MHRGIHFLLAGCCSRGLTPGRRPGNARSRNSCEKWRLTQRMPVPNTSWENLPGSEEKWEEAVSRFSQAAKLDSNFAEAYLGWGASLSH